MEDKFLGYLKKIYILIIFLILNKLCFGQNDSLKIHKKNEIKWDIFNTLVFSNKNKIAVQLFYERFLTRRNQSIQLSLAINNKFGFYESGYGFSTEPNITHSIESKSIAVNYNFIFPHRNKFSSRGILEQMQDKDLTY